MFRRVRRTFSLPCRGVNPAGCHAVHARNAGETVGEAVRQGRDGALGRCVALGVALGHEGARRGDVDDARAGLEMIFQQQREVVGCRDADRKSLIEIRKGTAAEYSGVGDGCVVDQKIHAAVARQDLATGLFQKGLFAEIAGDKQVVGPQTLDERFAGFDVAIDHHHACALRGERLRNTAANTVRTSGNNSDFILQHRVCPHLAENQLCAHREDDVRMRGGVGEGCTVRQRGRSERTRHRIRLDDGVALAVQRTGLRDGQRKAGEADVASALEAIRRAICTDANDQFSRQLRIRRHRKRCEAGWRARLGGLRGAHCAVNDRSRTDQVRNR